MRPPETAAPIEARAPVELAYDSLAAASGSMRSMPLSSSSRAPAFEPSQSRTAEPAQPRTAEPAQPRPRAVPDTLPRRSEHRSAPIPTVRAAPALLAAPIGAASSARSLLAEVRALDRIREALRESRDTAALEQLAAYERSFPDGELELEAAVLKVKALFAAQRSSEARALARATVARTGSERYRSELRDFIERTE